MILTSMVSDHELTERLDQLRAQDMDAYQGIRDTLEEFITSAVCLLDDDEIHALIQRDIDFYLGIDGCNK